MLTEFDQTTLANMTAALEYVCRKIPAGRDSHELRKQIGDAMIASARTSPSSSYIDFQAVGLKTLEDFFKRPKSGWFGRLFR